MPSPSSKHKPASVSLEELQALRKEKELVELEQELVELADLAYLAELVCLAELSSLSNTRPKLPSPSDTRAAIILSLITLRIQLIWSCFGT